MGKAGSLNLGVISDVKIQMNSPRIQCSRRDVKGQRHEVLQNL